MPLPIHIDDPQNFGHKVQMLHLPVRKVTAEAVLKAKQGIREYIIAKDDVIKWQEAGFNVRAWGVFDEELMRKMCDAGVNGMTCNFPDKLNGLLYSCVIIENDV